MKKSLIILTSFLLLLIANPLWSQVGDRQVFYGSGEFMIFLSQNMIDTYRNKPVKVTIQRSTSKIYTGSTVSLTPTNTDYPYAGTNYLNDTIIDLVLRLDDQAVWNQCVNDHIEGGAIIGHIGNSYHEPQLNNYYLGYGIYDLIFDFDGTETTFTVDLGDLYYPYDREEPGATFHKLYYDICFYVVNLNSAHLYDINKYESYKLSSVLRLSDAFYHHRDHRLNVFGVPTPENFLPSVSASIEVLDIQTDIILTAYGHNGAKGPWDYKWYYWVRPPFENTYGWVHIPSADGDQTFVIAAEEIENKYKVEVFDEDGNMAYQIWYSSSLKERIDVKNNYDTENLKKLNAYNYPNPFNPASNINFSIPNEGLVNIDIFNINGQLVKSYGERYYYAGTHSLSWNVGDNNNIVLSSGLYFYKIDYKNSENGKREQLINRMLYLK